MRVLKTFISATYHYLERQTEEAGNQITLFAIVMIINFPLFGILWNIERFQLNEEFYLRFVASTLCVLLILNKFGQNYFPRTLPIMWYLTLLFCLPFFICYLTLLNNGSTLWLMNCVSAIFFLLLLTNVLDALILLVIGTCLAFFSFLYRMPSQFVYIPGDVSLYSLSITYIAAIVIGALFARDRELIHKARLSGMRLLATGSADELRALIASNILQPELEEFFLEKLSYVEERKKIKDSQIAYDIDTDNQLISKPFIIQEEKFDTNNFGIHSIKNLLENTLNDFQLKEQQKSLIKLDIMMDFSIWIEGILFKNMIGNLLKDRLNFIEKIGQGNITIWLDENDEGKDFNVLHIREIYPKPILKRVDSFYSPRQEESGFTYCKLLMEAAGGDIYCEEKSNEYAHFILTFPKVD